MNSGLSAAVPVIGLGSVLVVLVPVLAAMAAGFGARRTGILTAEADQSFVRFTLNILFPCLILHSLLGNPALTRLHDLVLAPVTGFAMVALGTGVAWVAGASISRERRVRGTFAVVTGVFNYGFVALPLAFRFFDRQTVAVLFLFNVGVELAMWLFGMLLLSGAPAREGVRKVVNPPVCTIIVAVALTLTGIARFTPEWAMNTFDFLGRTAVPLALVLAGASMFDHIRELTGAGTLKTASLGVVLRMGFLPVLFVAAAVWIPFSLELKRVLVLQAAMPSAVFPVVMAKHYGGCTATALRVALATAIASLLATPLILRAGVLLLE